MGWKKLIEELKIKRLIDSIIITIICKNNKMVTIKLLKNKRK